MCSDEEMVIRDGGEDCRVQATQSAGGPRNADEDIGSRVFGLSRGYASVEKTGGAVLGGGDEDVCGGGDDGFDHLLVTCPECGGAGVDIGVADLGVQTSGDEVGIVCVGHEVDAEDVEQVAWGDEGAMLEGGNVPETQSAIVRG